MALNSLPSLGRATRVRYGVLAFACTLAMITYLDRVCMGSALPRFRDALGLSSTSQLNLALAAFALAYSIFEVPTGWLGDVFGPRKTLMRIVLWWSAFTAITGMVGLWAWNGWTISIGPYTFIFGWMAVLVIVRFLFGVGEAGAFPNITRALHNWFPVNERGFAQGCVWMSGRLMGGLTPFVWLLCVEGVGTPPGAEAEEGAFWLPPLLSDWRHAFYLFGLMGIAWCAGFYLWFRNRPEEKKSVNKAELELINAGRQEGGGGHGGVPWRRLLTSRNLWLLCTMYACQSYGWYFYINYIHSYLETQYGVARSSVLGAAYKGGPLWMGAIGCLIGGLLTDYYIRRTGDQRRGRKLFGIIGHAATSLCFLAVFTIESLPERLNPFWFFLAISLAGFFTDLTMGPAWATCQDIGRRYAAIVAGFMNMIGNLGGTIASYIVGWIVQRSLAAHAAAQNMAADELSNVEKAAGELGGYQINFLIFAGVYVIGVACWSMIDASKPIADT